MTPPSEMNPDGVKQPIHGALLALIILACLLPLAHERHAQAQELNHPQNAPWQAHWITSSGLSKPTEGSSSPDPVNSPRMPLFRDDFVVEKPVAKATLRISGMGQYEAHLNGRNVTDAVLTPGWTYYPKRVLYDTYDVSRFLAQGKNTIGVMLGRGMYDVPATPGRYTKFNGSFGPLQLIAQLEIEYTDGARQTIATGDTWKTAPGPITFSSAYGGEDFDARLEPSGWDSPAFDASTWSRTQLSKGPGGVLTPETIPAIKPFDRFEPVAITHPAAGVTVYDLGQNFSGWPEIEVAGPLGTRIKLVAGELLDAKGFVTQHSANASPEDENAFNYVLSGRGVEHWHPRFSYWGFRYIQTNQPDGIIRHLDGRFLHDAVDVTGSFTTSNPLLNRIHKLIDMAMLSNMVSVLTDCPHREKLGWLEQTHLAAASLMYNYDLSELYAKMADDMQDSQLPSGLVPDIAPELTVFEGPFRDSPEWGAADILSAWAAYQFYGDPKVLEKHYGSMASYIAYLKSRTEGHLLAYGLGDWYDIGPGEPGESKLTSKGVTASAIYYQALTSMQRIAALTGHQADVESYKAEADHVKSAFNQKYFHQDSNQYDTASQTANAMPLVVGLVPENARPAVLANLVADIRAHNNHVTAGDIGFHYVVRALTDADRSDVLYDMLSRTDKPSYGDQLAHGATTLTEAWDANPSSSQNHFMLGHAEEWFYRGLAGIRFNLDRDPDELDERIVIHPAVVGGIQSAKATFHSSLGPIESAWSIEAGKLHMTVSIPENATATIILPTGFTKAVEVNGSPLKIGGPILKAEITPSSVRCAVSSGKFEIEATKP